MRKYPLLGSYVPLGQKTGNLPGSLKIALEEDANTFMFYTGAPQNTMRRPVEDFQIDEFKSEIKDSGIDINTLAIHAPYVVNLANSKKPQTFEFGVEFLIKELNRAHAMGVNIVVLHPGAAVGATVQEGLDQLVKGLDRVIEQKPKGLKIALETMAGKGTEVGTNFDQMRYIIFNVQDSSDLGICIDTCHLYDAGYDVKNNWDKVKSDFDRKIGNDKLFCMHINDSKFGYESHKDRHANIGYGQIGFEAICNIVNDETYKDVPKYLETPYIGDVAPYKYEIESILNNKFVDFISEIEKNN